MATASVGSLRDAPHDNAQREWVAESRVLFSFWQTFDPAAYHANDDGAVDVLGDDIRPYEGWLSPAATAWYVDPMGTERAYHDVAPDDGRTTAATMAAIADDLRAALREHGLADNLDTLLRQRLCHRFDIVPPEDTAAEPMAVTVVNTVHSSYWRYASDEGGGGGDTTDGKRPIMSQAFFWRRLQHLGYQQSFVHTSLKLCYIPPLNASHILFQTGRMLETGANNIDVAEVMLTHGMLPYLRAAGLRTLVCHQRKRTNFVATSVLPGRRRLDLPRLHWQHQDKVDYNVDNFAGAIIKVRHVGEKATMLAFGAGPIVCVGTRTFEQLCAAFAYIYPLVMDNALPPPPITTTMAESAAKPRKRKAEAAPAAGASKRGRFI